jgi:hypothetical protein
MLLLVLGSIEAAIVVPLTARAHCARRNLELHELDMAEKRRRFSGRVASPSINVAFAVD